jgi:hypothetical protein
MLLDDDFFNWISETFLNKSKELYYVYDKTENIFFSFKKGINHIEPLYKNQNILNAKTSSLIDNELSKVIRDSNDMFFINELSREEIEQFIEAFILSIEGTENKIKIQTLILNSPNPLSIATIKAINTIDHNLAIRFENEKYKLIRVKIQELFNLLDVNSSCQLIY